MIWRNHFVSIHVVISGNKNQNETFKAWVWLCSSRRCP
jgi:hypothetical protein